MFVAIAHDEVAHFGRPSEGYLVHQTMLRQVFTRLTKACYDVYHSSWKTCLLEKLTKHQRSDWRLLSGFEDNCASCSQRRGYFPRHHKKRVIPGNDLGYHSNRLFFGVSEEGRTHGESAAFNFISLSCEIPINICSVGNIFVF